MRIQNTQQVLHRVGIDKFIEAYDDGQPTFYTEWVGDTISDKQAFYRFQIEGDFGYAQVVNEGSPGNFDDFRAPYSLDVTPLKRQLGWSSSTEALEADIYQVLNKSKAKIKDSLRATKEQAAAAQFVNFTSTSAPYACADTLALLSASHTTESGTSSNVITNTAATANPALSYDALEGAIQVARDTQSHRGKPNPIVGPFKLMVPHELLGLANRLVMTTQGMPQSNNNDINWARGIITGVHANPWFTDTNNWGMIVQNQAKRPIKLIVKRPATMHEDYDIYTDSRLWSVNEIYSFCNPDWRGFLGSNVS